MNSNSSQTTNTNIASQCSLEIACEPDLKEWSSSTMPLNKNSKEVKELEKAGYKVIFPAALSEDAVSQLSEQERSHYEINKNNALIIDPAECCRSLDLARHIASHYYSSCPGTITGVDYNENSLAIFAYGDFDIDTHKSLHETFSTLGYHSSLTGYQISVASDVPYPCVKKSKLEQIYTNAKDRINTVVKNIGWGKSAKINDSLSI